MPPIWAESIGEKRADRYRAVSLFYMAGAAVLTPELWIEPLGAPVKTGPAIVLMMVALAMSDDR